MQIRFANLSNSPNDFSIKLSPTKNLPVPYQIDEEAEPAARQPKVGWLHHQLPRRIGMRLDIQPPGFRLPPAFPFQFRQTTWTNVHHQWSTVLFHFSSQVQHFPNIFPFHLKLTTISIIQYQWSLLFLFHTKISCKIKQNNCCKINSMWIDECCWMSKWKNVNDNLMRRRECSTGRKSRMKKTIDNFYGSKMIRHMFNEGIPGFYD